MHDDIFDSLSADNYIMLELIVKQLDERQARWFVAREAMLWGHGGIRQMERLTGMSRPTITRGIRELKEAYKERNLWGHRLASRRIRIPGGGRKPLLEKDATLQHAIEKVMIEYAAGDPMGLLYWTQKSTRSIAAELKDQGYTISVSTLARRLHEFGYSLQVTRKATDDEISRLKDEQFRYINTQVEDCIRRGRPAIFIDCQRSTHRGTNKQEAASDNGDLPREHACFTSVGLLPEISECASEVVHGWWRLLGCIQFPEAESLLICVNCGKTALDHLHEWNEQLQILADRYRLLLTVSHVPSATFKWNMIDHQMSSLVSLSCQGMPLADYRIDVGLVSETRAKSTIHLDYDELAKQIAKGAKPFDAKRGSVNVRPQKTLPQWNYTINSLYE